MSEKEKEKMLELLSDMAIFGLSDAERAELAELEKDFPELNDNSLDLTAAAIGMMNLNASESMPAHLRSQIAADAEKYFASAKQENSAPETKTEEREEFQKTFTFEPKRSIFSWLGWLVAALACLVLIVNIYRTNSQMGELSKTMNAEIERLKNSIPTPTPQSNAMQERAAMMSSATDVIESTLGDLDPKKPQNIKGDVVWSNSQQKGYVRFSNLPVNDKTKEQYQLWVFDENQKYPVDGGVFDANENGEIVIPINAKIKVQKPKMFAVTAEKPGGVVVSPLEKVMAVAKVST